MKQGMKNIFPTFLSLVNILVFEILNNVDAIKQTLKFDLQLISNVLIIMIGVYSILRMWVELKQGRKLLEVHCLNNFLIVVCAFVLNIIVFEDKISKFKELFTEWHTLWSVWFGILFIWFTSIGKYISLIWRNMIQDIQNDVKDFKRWVRERIRKANKGMVFVIALGVVLWSILLKFISQGKNEVSVETIFEKSLIFWWGWFVIWMLIFFFIHFLPQIGPSVKNMQSGKTNKVFLRTIISVGILFVAVQVLPHILPVIGNLISFAIIIFGLILTVIYFGREKIQQNFKVKWEDLTIVLGIFYLVTFILLPGIGTTTMEVGNVEDVKTYLELITAGIEFFKEFL